MSDIATIWSPQALRGDYALAGASLASEQDLATAVLISIFTDRVANGDDTIPDNTADRRGWWADLGEDVPIGSRLWLLSRSKETAAVLAAAHDYIVEALQWLLDDGVAAAVDVVTEWTRPGMLGAQVTVTRGDGATFAWAWDEI
jgi:phage gp46-like protein